MPNSTIDENANDYVGSLAHRGPASSYSSLPALYLPPGWRDGWDLASGNERARALFVGDSITAGQMGDEASPPANTYDWDSQSYYGYLKAILAAQFEAGLGAEFYGFSESYLRNPYRHNAAGSNVAAEQPIYFADGSTNPSGQTSTAFFTAPTGSPVAASVDVGTNGWWQTALSSTTTAWTSDSTYMLSFMPTQTDVVRIDLLWANYYGGGAATIKYGSVAAGTGKVTSASRAASNTAVYRETIWTGAASQPRVYVGTQSASQALALLGFVAYRNTAGAGLSVGRMGFTGRTMGEFTRTESGVVADRPMQILGGSADGGTTWDQVGFPTCPDLAILALGVNDCNATFGFGPTSSGAGACLGPDSYGKALTRCIDAGRRAKPNMSFLIVCPYYPVLDFHDSNTGSGGFSNNDSWIEYVRVAHAVGAAKTAAVATLNARWRSTPVTRGYLVNGDGHPIPPGYQDMANLLAGAF